MSPDRTSTARPHRQVGSRQNAGLPVSRWITCYKLINWPMHCGNGPVHHWLDRYQRCRSQMWCARIRPMLPTIQCEIVKKHGRWVSLIEIKIELHRSYLWFDHQRYQPNIPHQRSRRVWVEPTVLYIYQTPSNHTLVLTSNRHFGTSTLSTNSSTNTPPSLTRPSTASSPKLLHPWKPSLPPADVVNILGSTFGVISMFTSFVPEGLMHDWYSHI